MALRREVGMVFQKSNPFPKSIYDNIAYGLRLNRMAANRAELDEPCRGEPARRRAVGRGEGPAARIGAGALGRAAAAPVHRARARDQARRSC